MIDIDFYYDFDSGVECIINDKRQYYDACTTGNLYDAINYYKSFKYIGTDPKGTIFINGKKQVYNIPHHFFKKLSKKEHRQLKIKKLNNEFNIQEK